MNDPTRQPRMVGQPMPMTAQQPAPVIPIGPDPAQRKLMQAMMARQMQDLSQARTPQEAVGRALPLYAATFRDYQDRQSAKERQEALTKALTGAEDYDSLIGAMIGSGDPDYQKAALSQRLKQFAPKEPEKPLRGKDRFITTKQGVFDTVDQMIVPGTEIEDSEDKPIKVGDALVQEQEDGTYAPVYQAPAKPATDQLTPAQKAVDQAFGKDYAASVAGGGYADAQKNLGQLKSVIEDLGSKQLTGPFIGSTPDFITKFTHPEAIDVRERVEEVVQRNLREILGAQFTETEGERLISRAYNPRLPEHVNKKRLQRLHGAMEKAYEAKQDAARHYEEHGTLSNYPGSARLTVEDFEKAIEDEGGDGGNSPVQVRSPQERDALPPGTQYIAPDGSVRTKQ